MHPEKVAHFSKEADEEQESSKKDDSSNFSDTSYDGMSNMLITLHWCSMAYLLE